MTNATVKLRPHNYIPYTLVPNFFIDHHLANTNGEFIKVYLVLLRYMAVGHLNITLDSIADLLYMTESDVRRALTYFEQKGLLTLAFEGNRLSEIHLIQLGGSPDNNKADLTHREPNYNESPYDNTSSDTSQYEAPQYRESQYQESQYQAPRYQEPQYNEPQYQEPSYEEPQYEDKRRNLKVVNTKPDYTTQELAYFAEQSDFKSLLYMTEKYMGKSLSNNDIQTIISFHDWLGLPIDVIELLIEYCVDNDHRHMRYIEKVAIDWADSGINTVEKAKVRTETYNKSYYHILKAYGITDRSPTPKQIQLMDKWLNEYNFDISVIVDACERTIEQINKPEMRYTDSILTAWAKEGVKTVADISKLPPKPNNGKTYNKAPVRKNTTFNNYSQRQYDYDALEKKAMDMRLKDSNGKRYSS